MGLILYLLIPQNRFSTGLRGRVSGIFPVAKPGWNYSNEFREIVTWPFIEFFGDVKAFSECNSCQTPRKMQIRAELFLRIAVESWTHPQASNQDLCGKVEMHNELSKEAWSNLQANSLNLIKYGQFQTIPNNSKQFLSMSHNLSPSLETFIDEILRNRKESRTKLKRLQGEILDCWT